jgi:Protein of unknown function (DUF2490)
MARVCLVTVLASCFGVGAAAQDQRGSVWPELDFYHDLNSRSRIFALAKFSKDEDTDPTQMELGINVEVALPLPFDSSEGPPQIDKDVPLLFAVGYSQYYEPGNPLNGPNPEEYRGIIELTPGFTLAKRFRLTDRNRLELRGLTDGFFLRYRNRIQLAGEVKIRGYPLTPYAYVEFYYSTQFSAWNENQEAAGVEFPLRPEHVGLDVYLLHQNNSRSDEPHVNALGIKLKLTY